VTRTIQSLTTLGKESTTSASIDDRCMGSGDGETFDVITPRSQARVEADSVGRLQAVIVPSHKLTTGNMMLVEAALLHHSKETCRLTRAIRQQPTIVSGYAFRVENQV